MKSDEKDVDGNMERVKDMVRKFWDSSPCGTYLIKHKEGTEEYFEAIDDNRYNKYPYAYSHIPRVVGFDKWKGKRVLEIGCGVGTDLSQFAKYLILMWKIIINRRYRHLPKNDALNRITEQNKNPAGPVNPLTKMYTKCQARELFSKFRLVKIRVYWIRVPYFCTTGLLSRLIGWHLIIEARK